jgi:hypothetical protein
MYFAGFDTELLRVNGDAYARGLERSMAAVRRGHLASDTRRWIGGRLISVGAALAADPGLARQPHAAKAGAQGR